MKLSGLVKDESFKNILFEDLVVRNATFQDVLFSNVHFFQSYIGFNSTFKSVRFEKCKFYGQYSSLGGVDFPTNYEDCVFQNCKIEGLDKFTGANFINCFFSGSFKNILLYDTSGTYESGTIFKNCDLKDVLFDNVTCNGNGIFQQTILPHVGLIVLDNSLDAVHNYFKGIKGNLEPQDIAVLDIVLKCNSKTATQYLILDELLISQIFETDASKKVFQSIVDRFRISEKQIT